MEILFILSVISSLTIVSALTGDLSPLGMEILETADGELICERSGPVCASDCSTLMVCAANNPTPINTVTCSSPNQYCVGNACKSVASVSCPNGPSFACTDDGIFPEPSDCRRSRVCEAGVSKLYECITGFVFNSRLNMCQQGTTPCTRIDCSRATATNPYIVYASNPAYFALCVNNGNGNIQTYMFRCPNEQFEIFDTTINSCRFNCAARGYFQNPNNCTEYFHCNAATASTRPTLLSCPTNFVFDGTGCNSDPSSCIYDPEGADGEDGNPIANNFGTI